MTKTRLFTALVSCACLVACGSGGGGTNGNIATDGADNGARSDSALAPTPDDTDASPVASAAGGNVGLDGSLGAGGSPGGGGMVGSDGGTGSGDGCPSLAGAYAVTTQIVSTTCRLGLNAITPSTYTFTQTAPGCQFTMTNSIYSGSVYAGHFVMAGTNAKVIWDSVDPPPTSVGYALSYTAEDLTLTPGATAAASTLFGTFTWHSAAECDGTTNVCSGTVSAGCPTPQ